MGDGDYSAYQLKVTLVDSAPEIWRKVLVPARTQLKDLHDILQIAMGWENQHDYLFRAELGKEPCDVNLVLMEVLNATGYKPMYYSYDFKCGWLHRIEAEKYEAIRADGCTDQLAQSVQSLLPLCTGGAFACPPEGSGGVWGYDDFLARLEDPDGSEYLDLIEKYGDFDPDKFDGQGVNSRYQSSGLSRLYDLAG